MLIDFRELFPKYDIKPNGVLHIGANRGEEAPVYRQLGIDNQIWIEANPDMYTLLRDTLRDNDKATAYNCAAGEDDNVDVVLHIANNMGQSSSILELGTHKEQHPEVHYVRDVMVRMRRIDTLIPEIVIENYDFLNIDIQGYELFALRGMGDYLKYFKWLYLEVNRGQVYEGCADVSEVDAYVASFGFKRVETKWIGNWGDALYVR